MVGKPSRKSAKIAKKAPLDLQVIDQGSEFEV